jgi:hypothetical protein
MLIVPKIAPCPDDAYKVTQQLVFCLFKSTLHGVKKTIVFSHEYIPLTGLEIVILLKSIGKNAT